MTLKESPSSSHGTVVKLFPKRNIKSRRLHGLVQLDQDGEVIEFSGYFKGEEEQGVMVGTHIWGTRIHSRGRYVLRNAERKW